MEMQAIVLSPSLPIIIPSPPSAALVFWVFLTSLSWACPDIAPMTRDDVPFARIQRLVR